MSKPEIGVAFAFLASFKIVVSKGKKKKYLTVYPSMWVEPYQNETIFISDIYLKNAMPYAVQKIIENF